MTAERFFALANGRCHARVFDRDDFVAFDAAICAAVRARRKFAPFYAEGNAGGVGKSYGWWSATTARWAAYVDPDTREVVAIVDRVGVSGPRVKCVFDGGANGYARAWRLATLRADWARNPAEVIAARRALSRASR